MDKFYSPSSTDPGLTTPSLLSRCAFLLKRTSKHVHYCKSCESRIADPGVNFADHLHPSAELEITVSLLIQLDKLVQLLESPVFTCALPPQFLLHQGAH